MRQDNSEAKIKICIELDEEMKELWEIAKESLEEAFETNRYVSVSLTDSEIFRGILRGWDFAEADCMPFFYATSFSDKEVQALAKRKQQNSN